MHLRTPKRRSTGFAALPGLICLACLLCGYTHSGASYLSPHIIQLLTLSNGRIFALTEDKKGLFYSTDSGRKWTQPVGLPEAYLYAVSEAPSGNLFLTTSSGVFRSKDGASWVPAAEGKATFVVFSPDGSGALCKMWGKGLFRTSQGYLDRVNLSDRDEAVKERARLDTQLKVSWNELMRLRELPDRSPEKLQLPNQYREWQALHQQAEQSSKPADAAAEEVTGLPAAPVHTLIYRNSKEIFAGFFGQGAYRSQDGGNTWLPANEGLSNRHVLALGASPRGDIFAGTYRGGLFRFLDTGPSWSVVKTGLVDGVVQCIAFAPSGLMLIGTRGEGVLISRDGGQTWNRPDGLLRDANVHALSAGPGGLLYAGAYQAGLFVSADEGETWAPKPFAYLSYVKEVAADDNGLWYVDVKGLGLMQSSDKGRSWAMIDLPFPYQPSVSFAVGRRNLMAAGDLKSGVHISQDGGKSWKKIVGGHSGKGVFALRANEAGDIYAASSEGMGLYILVNSAEWQKIMPANEDGDDYTCWDVVFLPDSQAVAYGLTDILISRDQLSSWRRTRFGQPFRNLWMDRSGRIWTERILTTFFLKEDGEWEESVEIPKDRYTHFSRIDDQRFAAARMEGGVDVLRRTGNVFEIVRQGLEDKDVLSLATDPEPTILAGCETGLWISSDMGETWREIALQP